MEKIYGMHKLLGLQLFWSRTPTFSSGTPTFWQMGVLNSCFQNPSESSDHSKSLKSQVEFDYCFFENKQTQNTALIMATKIKFKINVPLFDAEDVAPNTVKLRKFEVLRIREFISNCQ